MAAVLAVLILAAGLSALAYRREEGLGRRVLAPALCRAVAWAGLGLLLLNPSCPAPPRSDRPLVLLDASLSMSAAGGQWGEAAAFADSVGEVQRFGDEVARDDSLARPGRSLLVPALRAAVATGRPVMVVTDGEITDGAQLDPALLAAVTLKVFPRRPGPSAGVASLDGPARAREGDSTRIGVEVRTVGLDSRSVAVDVIAQGRPIAGTRIRTEGDGAWFGEVVLPPGVLPAGEHILSVGLADSLDPDWRDDRRLHRLLISDTPGIVLVAAAPDWESRFLYRTLVEVTSLPVEGYVQVQPGAWRRMADLAPVGEAGVRRAIARADLQVRRGPQGWFGGGRAPSLWWPMLPPGQGEADWYLAPGPDGPLAGALVGSPVDSFPPATGLAPVTAGPGTWTGLTGRASRRGAARPVMIGTEQGGRREVIIGAQGLWRWAFRGGSSEQAYRSLVAGTVDWLLGGQDSTTQPVSPIRHVVPNGIEVAFESRQLVPEPVEIRFESPEGPVRVDTLRFDGAGRAAVRLEPGTYLYTLPAGGGGTVAVEEWSDEWFPRAASVSEVEAVVVASSSGRALRDRIWWFGVILAALSLEWFLRRRLGLR